MKLHSRLLRWYFIDTLSRQRIRVDRRTLNPVLVRPLAIPVTLVQTRTTRSNQLSS